MRNQDTPPAASGPASGEERNDGGYNAGMAVFSYIIGGIIVWSLIGLGLDKLLGTQWFVLAGALIGLAGSFYLVHKHRLFRRTDSDGNEAPDGPAKRGDDGQ